MAFIREHRIHCNIKDCVLCAPVFEYQIPDSLEGERSNAFGSLHRGTRRVPDYYSHQSKHNISTRKQSDSSTTPLRYVAQIRLIKTPGFTENYEKR